MLQITRTHSRYFVWLTNDINKMAYNHNAHTIKRDGEKYTNVDTFIFLRTKSKLRNDKALLLHVVDTDEVSPFFAALFLTIGPCLRRTIKVIAPAVVGNPGIRTKSLHSWGCKRWHVDVKHGWSHRVSGSVEHLMYFLYFGEGPAELRLCSRCSRTSWCRIHFARCAAQPCRGRHSCIRG